MDSISRKKSMTRTVAFGLGVSAVALLLAFASADAHEQDGRSPADLLLFQGQKICPVTGKELTSMGAPVKARVNGQTVFLCCRGCIGRPPDSEHLSAVQRNLRTTRLVLAQRICPVSGRDLFAGDGPVKARAGGQSVFLCSKGCFEGQIQRPHWERIQAHLAAAQGRCPVMNNPLPKQSASTVLKGRRVFVCCPPCVEKMEAAPEKYLATVDKLLAEEFENGQEE